MDPIRLKLALKRRPAVDAVLRSAAWPVLQAQRLGADWAAWRRGRGAYDPEFAWLPPLQGKYRGRSCFVVGTGPSLCLEDLERIRPAYSFGVNAAVLALGQTGWRPDFYLIQDEYVYRRLEAALALAAVCYGRLFGWYGWGTLVLPTLVTLAPPLVFALGSGWLLGKLRPWLLYPWMAAPFVLSALPLPEALGLWNGSFFTSYPLTLDTLDPAFTIPGAAILAQCLVLAAGVLLLTLQPKHRGIEKP